MSDKQKSTDAGEGSAEHTHAPWAFYRAEGPTGYRIFAATQTRFEIAQALGRDSQPARANARRICAAVNFCMGTPTALLEAGVEDGQTLESVRANEHPRVEEVRAERARNEELEEALEEMVEVFGPMADMVIHRRTQAEDKHPYKRAVKKARAALASTESRKAEGSN